MIRRTPATLSLCAAAALALVAAAACGGSDSSSSPAFSCDQDAEACQQAIAGDYSGSYRGDATGRWSVTIDTDGNIDGTVVSTSSGDSYQVSGESDENGELLFGTVSDGSEFAGQLREDGTLSGAWTSTGGYDGTFSGKREGGAPVVASSASDDGSSSDGSSSDDDSSSDGSSSTDVPAVGDFSAENCTACLMDECPAAEDCAAVDGCLELIMCSVGCADEACVDDCLSGASTDDLIAALPALECLADSCVERCFGGASGPPDEADSDLAPTPTTTEDCSLSSCQTTSSGYSFEYSCGTADRRSSTDYDIVAGQPAGGTTVFTYTNDHQVTCDFSNARATSGSCSDDTGSSCRW